MKDYIERMIKEAIELDSRMKKLREYQDTNFDSDDFPPSEESILMTEQCVIMEKYFKTLERRIGLAMINEAKEQNNEASES